MQPDFQRWLRTPRRVERPRVRVVCFAYAGGGATVYHAWSSLLPADVEVQAVQLPARQDRLGEPGVERVEPIVAAVDRALDRLPPAPLVLYGHSYGTVLAYELSRVREVRHLVVGARRAPHLRASERIADLPMPALVARLQRVHGAPSALSEQPELLDLVMPSIRADLRALEAYTPAHRPPLEAPITALGGTRDQGVPVGELSAWGELTSARFERHMVDAGHLFVDTHRPWVIERLLAVLSQLS